MHSHWAPFRSYITLSTLPYHTERSPSVHIRRMGSVPLKSIGVLWAAFLLPFSLWRHICTVHMSVKLWGKGGASGAARQCASWARPCARARARPCMLAPHMHELLTPTCVHGTRLQANGGAQVAGQAARWVRLHGCGHDGHSRAYMGPRRGPPGRRHHPSYLGGWGSVGAERAESPNGPPPPPFGFPF